MKIGTIIQALNHPIRRDIIVRLREGPMNAGDLAGAYPVSKPTMSTHFAALKDAGLIEGRKTGVVIHYYLNATVAEEAMAALMDLFNTGSKALNQQPASSALSQQEESKS